jgi:hypothetical protein
MSRLAVLRYPTYCGNCIQNCLGRRLLAALFDGAEDRVGN